MTPNMIVVRAPVRISFGGGGTDLEAYYSRFGGFVVSTAITRYCYVVAREPQDRSIRLNSADYRCWQSFASAPSVEEPLLLPKAAVEWACELGLAQRGIDLFTSSEVPPGTGLGSSSAMAVALVQALATYLGLEMSQAQVAETACRLEIDRLDMPIGKQDQYASACGGLNALSFTRAGVDVAPVRLSPATRAALGERLLLFSTGLSRHSAGILREQRQDTKSKATVAGALHEIKILAEHMRLALLEGELDRFGELLDLAWQQKRSLSGKISSATIDGWYGAARSAGALGGKITGAGGGGFLLLYAPAKRIDQVRRTMEELGLQELTFDLDTEGVQVLAAPQRKDGGTLVGEGVLQGRRQRRRASVSTPPAVARTTGG